MKRDEILDSVKRTITQDRNNRHGEPENSFPLIANAWHNYLQQRDPKNPLLQISPSDVAEMMALFKDVRFHMQPENPDNKHDQIGYLAIACELRASEQSLKDIAPISFSSVEIEERRMSPEMVGTINALIEANRRNYSTDLRKCIVVRNHNTGKYDPVFPQEFEPLSIFDKLPSDIIRGDVIARTPGGSSDAVIYSVYNGSSMDPIHILD